MSPFSAPSRYPVRHTSDAQDPDWTNAAVLTDFSFPWEDRTPPDTEFRALWSSDSFHFRFDCIDEDLVLADGETDREKVMGSDRVEIFLTPDESLDPYYALEMDPRGAILDYRARFHRKFDWEWNCPGLQVSPSIEGNHYRVEGSLPMATLQSLGVLRKDSPEVLAGLYRAEFSHRADGSVHQGWMAWIDPQTERPDFHVPSSFGILEWVGFGER